MNANGIIYRALKNCGVLAAGETPAAADQQDAFDSLNGMLDSWKVQRLTCYQVRPYAFPIPNGVATATIGPTGTFVVATGAPVWIQAAANIQNYGVVDSQFEMPIQVFTPQEWAEQITMKTQQNNLLIGIYYQRGAPNGTINFWPVVTATGLYIALYLPIPLDRFADFTTDVPLPPGYEDALVYNLSKRIAPMFGRALDPVILELAAESIGLIKVSNENMDQLACDDALNPQGSGAFNYYTGDWQGVGGRD